MPEAKGKADPNNRTGVLITSLDQAAISWPIKERQAKSISLIRKKLSLLPRFNSLIGSN